MKTFFKEFIIVLLLILAILLVLGVLLYDYIPMNKVVPQIEQYETPENIKEELNETVDDSDTTMTSIVYEINESDLKLYEKSNDYQKGNVNPFADLNSSNTATEEGTDGNNTNGTVAETDNNTINNQTNNSSTGTNTNSEGTFLPSTGTK
jgi:hypothetical protein